MTMDDQEFPALDIKDDGVKKPYAAPELVVHGAVEKLTEKTGPGNRLISFANITDLDGLTCIPILLMEWEFDAIFRCLIWSRRKRAADVVMRWGSPSPLEPIIRTRASAFSSGLETPITTITR